jgi:hypothetical protein
LVKIISGEALTRHFEIYFGIGANADTDPTKIVDVIPNIAASATYSTRTYDALSIGLPPSGERDEVLSGRWNLSPDATQRCLIEYIESVNTRRAP